MPENDKHSSADELMNQLVADLSEGRITADQMRERLKTDAERPIDADMLRAYCDAHEQRLLAYSAMLQTTIEIATDQRDPNAWRRREGEVDEHVARMTDKLPLWHEQLDTVARFLLELRAGSGHGPVRLGDVSHATAHLLARHVTDMAAQAWQSCKDIAHRSRTDPSYLYATSACELFFNAHVKTLPKPNDLMALLQLERAAAMKALRDGQAPGQANAAHAANGVTIQTESVNVQGRSVSVAAEQVALNATLRAQDGAKRGKAGMEKWRRAQDKMMERLRQGTLPRSLRDTARTIEETYDTTRRAAFNSDALRTHFNLRDETEARNPSGSLLDELAKQADRRTQLAIAQMTPTQRLAAEEALREMEPVRRVELLRTLAADPEAGSTGDVSLIENADQDSRADDDWSG